MLTKPQIRKLLELCAEETVVRPSPGFPYRISREAHGYSKDPELVVLQMELSIMLEAARQ